MTLQCYVYILTNEPYGTLYIGYTNNLIKRIEAHKQKTVPGFSKQHGLDQLVWFEVHESAIEGRTREKQLKKWNRDWKINLIQSTNPQWQDLSDQL